MRIEADSSHSGERLDSFLSVASGLTRNAIQILIEGGHVLSNKGTVRKNDRITGSEVFDIEQPQPEQTKIMPKEIPLDIVFEDSELIVINKPRGMVVHPAAGHSDDTMVNALLAHCGDSLSGINGEIRPGIVHRLDKDTSGLIIAVKNDRAHRSIAQQIKVHSVRRVYEAVVRGGFKEDSGRIEASIGRNPTDRKKMAVTEKNARTAATNWEVIERFYGTSGTVYTPYTHIRCILETGRTHQIRVHMAHIGHPVAGDSVYGSAKDEFDLHGQCLHAKQIEFDHPTTGERICLETELPDYFKKVLTILHGRV